MTTPADFPRGDPTGPFDSDITFVVQGPVISNEHASTERCLRSIRHFFPGSRIILSTWQDGDVSSLPYDDLVFGEDPGPIVSERGGLRMANNLNRQIVSTNAGLDQVTSPLTVKLRSDALLTGRGFVNFLNAFPCRTGNHQIFKNRIVISKEFTRSAKSFVPLAYHPSDLFQFGLTDDLKMYWDIAPVVGDRLSQYFLSEAPRSWFSMFDRFRYTTEQYLFLDVLSRTGNAVHLNDFRHITLDIVRLSQSYLLNNFVPVEPELLSVHHAKFKSRAHASLMEDCIGLREFLSWYASAISGTAGLRPLGNAWPHMSSLLKIERVARELLKRIPLLQRMYAKRYLTR